MIRSFHGLNTLFEDTSEDDAPYPWKAMANKLDPVEFQEWSDAASLMELHAKTILSMNKSFRGDADKIISRLTEGYPSHSYSLTFAEAKKIFGNHMHFYNEPKYKKIWEVTKIWIRKYIDVELANHIIRYVLPEKGGANEKNKKKKAYNVKRT